MQRFLGVLLEENRLHARTARMDARELVWRWLNCRAARSMPDSGPDAALLGELVQRVMPGWASEENEITDRGWVGPDGQEQVYADDYPGPSSLTP